MAATHASWWKEERAILDWISYSILSHLCECLSTTSYIIHFIVINLTWADSQGRSVKKQWIWVVNMDEEKYAILHIKNLVISYMDISVTAFEHTHTYWFNVFFCIEQSTCFYWRNNNTQGLHSVITLRQWKTMLLFLFTLIFLPLYVVDLWHLALVIFIIVQVNNSLLHRLMLK